MGNNYFSKNVLVHSGAKCSSFQSCIGPICLLIWADVDHKRRIRGESSFSKSQKWRQQRLGTKLFLNFFSKNVLVHSGAKGSSFQSCIRPIYLLIWAVVDRKRRIRGKSSFFTVSKNGADSDWGTIFFQKMCWFIVEQKVASFNPA